MDLFSIFATSFVIALSGALAPGPVLASVIYESTRHGFKTGPLMMLGHALLEMAMVAFIIFGFSRFIHNAVALKTISYAGALILCYFGVTMLLSVKKLTLDFKAEQKSSANLVLLGITMSISNPYWAIWWLTIGFGLLLAANKAGLTAVAVFFLGHILADIGWYSAVSLSVSKGRKFLSAAVYRVIISVCALTLIGFGILFGIRA